MKTPFVKLKDTGAPDAVLAALAALMMVLSVSPWLDLSIGGVTLKGSLPWLVSPIAALLFVLLFVPCIPGKTESAAERELVHRFNWLRERLLEDPLSLENAWDARHALDGAGGGFRAAEDQFRDKHIEPILRNTTTFKRWEADVVQLRRLCQQLPNSIRPGDTVQSSLASKLRAVADKLPTAAAD